MYAATYPYHCFQEQPGFVHEDFKKTWYQSVSLSNGTVNPSISTPPGWLCVLDKIHKENFSDTLYNWVTWYMGWAVSPRTNFSWGQKCDISTISNVFPPNLYCLAPFPEIRMNPVCSTLIMEAYGDGSRSKILNLYLYILTQNL